ncbi:hypothetical protein WDU94_014108 [Cyamophila willieti]
MTTVSDQMIDAVLEGNLEKVKDLVKSYGIHSCEAWDYGYVLLQIAISKGFKEIACFLVTIGSKIHNKYSEDQTPLHYAVEKGDVELVQILLDNGADVTAANENYNTPLHIAVNKRHAAICKILCQYGAPLHVLNKRKQLPLFFAIEKGWQDIVTAFLEAGVDVNSEDKKCNSILYSAVTKGNVEMIKEILRFKPDLESINNKNSLLYAIGRYRDDHIVDILFDYGFSFSSEELKSNKLMKKIIDNNHTMAIKKLIACGGNPTSLLHVAVEFSSPDIVKLLLHFGADPNFPDQQWDFPDQQGWTPLHKLVCCIARLITFENINSQFKLRYEILKLLFEFKANANLQTLGAKRKAPLHLFCASAYDIDEKCIVEIIETLVKYGAQLDIIDENGNTPLHIAADSYLDGVCDVLLKYGADAYAVNYEGNTPFHLKGSSKAWTVLLNHYLNHNDNPALVLDLYKMLYSRFSLYDYYYRYDPEHKDIVCVPLQQYVIMANSLGYTIPNEEVILSKNMDNKETLKAFEISCKEEVVRMKQHMMAGSSLTLYHFLRKRTHALAICLKNEQISSYLAQGGYKETYPVYSRVIEGHYIRGKQRKQLLDKVDTKCHHLLPSLPQECALTLLGYLNNKDLSVLTSVLVPDKETTSVDLRGFLISLSWITGSVSKVNAVYKHRIKMALNVRTSLRNNWKKSVFGGVVLAYGTNYIINQIENIQKVEKEA